MNLIEVTVYALVLAGPSPALCQLQEDIVVCSNGLTARALSPSETRFSNGVSVRHAGGEFPAFSNGITSWFNGAGWLTFSNGVAVRRQSDSRFDFSGGITCRAQLPGLVECRRLADSG
jgi:hypothetical protein